MYGGNKRMRNNIINIFTKETCEKLKGMEQQERKLKLAGAITAFFQGKHPALTLPAIEIAKEAGVDEEVVQKVISILRQKGMTGPSDAPDIMNRNAPVTAGVFYTAGMDPLMDFGFEELFDFVDMRTAGQESFDILDVSNLITFTKRKSGSPAKVYGVTTGKTTVTLMEIAAAIGILDRWIDYAQFWNLNQAIIEARSKYYSKQAADHYALLVAISSGQNQAFSTNDVTTINNACAQILEDCESKGYSITGNETFELRAHVSLKQRIEYAMTTSFNSANGDGLQVVHAVNRKYTTKIVNTSYYVGLPGKKAKRGIWKDLFAESDRDILKGGTDIAYVGQYNAGIGEEDQFRRCALS